MGILLGDFSEFFFCFLNSLKSLQILDLNMGLMRNYEGLERTKDFCYFFLVFRDFLRIFLRISGPTLPVLRGPLIKMLLVE